MQTELTQKLTAILQKNFQFQEFRPGQLEAITLLMTQGRLLCIQPTGHGKSLLYQLPAVLLNGITLVISPLLALMRDQLTQLKNRFGISAASINTDQSDEENNAARYAAKTSQIRILFIAPEQLDHVDRFDFLLRLPIDLFVVDEAHCISTWGHDFRPSYRQIIKLAHALALKNPDLKLLGLTATANNKTELDIKQQLKIDQKAMIVQRESMDRPNIRLSVISTSGTIIKLATLTSLLKTLNGSGLIYCATRENTEIVADYLSGQGINIVAYHAGMEVQKKREIQTDFLHDKYQVISATNALGMGIDKGNLRFIIHFDFPGSITAYYQEVGRGGRDGLPAEGILLYDPTDSKIQRYFIEAAQPNTADFRDVMHAVTTTKTPPNLTLLKRLTGLHPTRLIVVIAELVEQGFLKKISQNRALVYQVTSKSGIPNLTRYTEQYKLRNHELAAMENYAKNSSKCLMLILRTALGDKQVHICGQCGNCVKTVFNSVQDKNTIFTISSWLNRRTVPITLSKKSKKVTAGIAVLDSKLRSHDFVNFMRERTSQNKMSDSLTKLVQECLTDLMNHHKLSCIIPIPSRTWSTRDNIVTALANYLKIPTLLNLLHWDKPPETRQGELLNNDQRQHNVAQRMRTTLDKTLPKGTILLFDDYIGSGATLNEAVRVLREHAKLENEIVPFTIAAVKWRLGKKGML